ncbi:uncharacterized protein [Palaemon carinicauda]|uniref:uncharacterized protein n=1 Tax=Palaemon carinicauda TaxID=392227 RepID=UPI0035B6471E
MWNKSKLSPIGETTLNVKNPNNDEIISVTFIVISNDLMCLLGSKTCQEIGFVFVNGKAFVSKIDIDHEMSDLGDLGEVKLDVDSTLPARILPCRRLPIAVKSKVQRELHSLVKRGVLIPETEPTEWEINRRVPAKHGIYHHIETTGPPTHCKFRRLPPQQLQDAKRASLEMKRMEIYKKASSPCASPLHMVKKPDGSWRPCDDCRYMNLVTMLYH